MPRSRTLLIFGLSAVMLTCLCLAATSLPVPVAQADEESSSSDSSASSDSTSSSDNRQCASESYNIYVPSLAVDSAAGAASSYGAIYETDALAFSGALADMGQKFTAYHTAVAAHTGVLSASASLVTAFAAEQTSYLALSGSELALSTAEVTLSGALAAYQTANETYMACAYPGFTIVASGSLALPEEPTYGDGTFDGTSSCDDLKTVIEQTKADLAKADAYIASLWSDYKYVKDLTDSMRTEYARLRDVRDAKILLNMWVDPDKTTITNQIQSASNNLKGLFHMEDDLSDAWYQARAKRKDLQKRLEAAELLWKAKPCMIQPGGN